MERDGQFVQLKPLIAGVRLAAADHLHSASPLGEPGYDRRRMLLPPALHLEAELEKLRTLRRQIVKSRLQESAAGIADHFLREQRHGTGLRRGCMRAIEAETEFC